VQRANQRQGFLVSAVIHLTLLMILLAQPPNTRTQDELTADELDQKELVFLPPPEVLRQLAPTPPPAARPRPAPTPPPETPDAAKKDRISVGPPTALRSEGPIILRRDDDLTKVPKGRPDAVPEPQATPTPAPPVPTPAPQVARGGSETPETPGREGLRLPPGLLGPSLPRGDEATRRAEGGIGSSVDEAVDEVTRRRLAQDGALGIPSGTGGNYSGFHFDPQGADFTVWLNHAKNQVYRNWIMPQAALMNFGGHVDFEITFERDGSVSALQMLKSSGTVSLDRAARNALTSSSFMALPDDYGPPRVTMQVTFYYGPPQQS
jgi:TonB family protein